MIGTGWVDISSIGADISNVAAATHRRYKGWIEEDDIAQHLREWAGSPALGGRDIQKWLEADDPKEAGRIRPALKGEASAFCEAEKAAKSGYEPEDVYWYTPARIARLVPDALDDSWPGEDCSSTGSSAGTPANQRLEYQVAVMDVRRVIDKWDNYERGALLQESSNPRFRTAISDILHALGDARPRRKHLTNAQAIAKTKQQEEYR